MTSYKELALRYLKMNKRRSIVTVLGVTVAAALLYLLLNIGWSGLLNHRMVQREKQDYEIVLMTETSEQIDSVMKDTRVKSASVGEYFYFDYVNPKTYKNALYINITNPYRMNSILDNFEDTYEVKGKLNEEIAWTYLQGNSGNAGVVIILAVILVSFFFAIFGVGIVRNSIQLSTLEQIKDYGNLRCIGASKGQLKQVVYLEGAVLEILGMVIGVFLGTLMSWGIGLKLQWKAGFHIIPLIPVIVAFLGDMYFVMEENCKVVTNMTPVSAIRGEYRIRKEKIKVRKKSIFGKLLGIEGDYAYKNIMRNPERFHKTVWVLGIGMALFITVMGCFGSVLSIEKDMKEAYKHYQIYYMRCFTAHDTPDFVQSTFPPSEILEKISNLEEVTEAKRIYAADMYVRDEEELYGRYTDEYLNDTWQGRLEINNHNKVISNKKEDPNYCYYDRIPCYGYDETDYKRFKSALIEGTLDVSENGIVLLNCGEESKKDSEYLAGESINVTYTDYKVGDTIDLIDMRKLRLMMEAELDKLTEEYKAEKEQMEASIRRGDNEYREQDVEALYLVYFNGKIRENLAECVNKLKKEKAYKTYTIEGIVKEETNRMHEQTIAFILPLDQYFDFTATDETMVAGMQYHFEKFSYDKYVRTVGEEWVDGSGICIESLYPQMIQTFDMAKGINYVFILFIAFIVMMTAFNVINTTASNMHIRRKEFAQLRVIGVTKSGLMKMVMLEGVIETLAASLIGTILGIALSYTTFHFLITIIYGIQYKFPFMAAVIAFFVSALILCGSAYMSIRGMKQDMAADLSTGGD